MEHHCNVCGGSCRDSQPANDNRPSLPTVYIAGRMSGMPDLNYPMFHAAAANLRKLGYKVESPAECELPPETTSWQQFMRSGITQLMRCDAIVMLPGWEPSRGANAENAIAKMIDMPVMTLAEAIEHGLAWREAV